MQQFIRITDSRETEPPFER